jgi:uncharacterized protein with NRDE domain
MCLVLLAFRAHDTCRLVVASNRDEEHARPTANANFWPDDPGILAGRDLRSGGTWSGVTTSGRFAAITNFRDAADRAPRNTSRGSLVRHFLSSDVSSTAYLEALEPRLDDFAGFGLFVYDGESLDYISNRGDVRLSLPPGIYGLSNHLLDTPWPKVVRGKSALAAALQSAHDDEGLLATLFALLGERTIAGDAALPDTGVGAERERLLAPLFVVDDVYGTRASTVLLMRDDGAVRFSERTFDPAGEELTRSDYSFHIS